MLAIVFSILTLGIYFIYWFVKVTDDVNKLSPSKKGTPGILALLFSIITFGIYTIYWAYKMGKKCDEIAGNPNGNTSIIFVLMALFGVTVLVCVMAQDTVNRSIA